MLHSCCFSCSENTQYQLLYSHGTGVIHVLGIVPQSHLNILTFSVEDGEITKQVVLDYRSKILNLMLTNVLPARWAVVCRVINCCCSTHKLPIHCGLVYRLVNGFHC